MKTPAAATLLVASFLWTPLIFAQSSDLCSQNPPQAPPTPLNFKDWTDPKQFKKDNPFANGNHRLCFSPAEKKITGELEFNKTCPKGSVGVFVKLAGEGPWVTTLHGYPTSSMDWSRVLPDIEQNHRVLLFDYVGFGNSDKPIGHYGHTKDRYPYSTQERSDLVQALWEHFNIKETQIVSHDIGDTVAMEILARRKADPTQIGANITNLVMLNGGIFSRLHSSSQTQEELTGKWADYYQTKIVAGMILQDIGINKVKDKYKSGVREISNLPDADLNELWASYSNHDGPFVAKALASYNTERKAPSNQDRWETLVGNPGVPTTYIWGAKDPVTQNPRLGLTTTAIESAVEAAKKDPGHAPVGLVQIPGAGHYPQLEKAAVVGAEIRRALNRCPPAPVNHSSGPSDDRPSETGQ